MIDCRHHNPFLKKSQPLPIKTRQNKRWFDLPAECIGSVAKIMCKNKGLPPHSIAGHEVNVMSEQAAPFSTCQDAKNLL